ncbi:M48 family metallopeptidase [Roseovarius sp. MMSF_3281]|uniref:M48 family metallopeptidase n=1 Tax=Roseovarius sp. MMSF_3281 TaxID=3046694 RepID=UPI00273EA0DF|nr:M48 family metallopeptidase [Roseovarius sp. MMSF_3281]
MGPVTGSFFDGQHAGRHRVEVTLDEAAGELIVTGPSLPEALHWPCARLRALEDLARGYSLTLTLHAETEDEAPRDPARLTINEPAMVARIRELCPDLHKRDLHRGTWRKIWTRGAMAVGAVVLMLFVILPRMADTLATIIPVEREIAFGKSVIAQMERALGAADLGDLRCRGEAGQAALDRMVARLSEGQDLQYDLEVRVFDDGMVNAFAAPGGQIVIMRGLLEDASGPDAVAAVLAHEIGHVEARDATRIALRAAGSAGLLSMVLGDFTGGTIAVVLGERIMQASYTREAEAAADVFALDMLNAAGVDSSGMAEFFDYIGELQGEFQIPEYLSTHPASEARAERARDNAEGQEGTTPVLGEAAWQALKGICG